MSYPAYTAAEAQARETFLALMWSLSYPGRVYHLPVSGAAVFQAIADALLDIETSFFTADDALAPYLGRNGARALSPERAAYHFYPDLTQDQLDTVKQASIGSLMYPDKGATLIIGAKLGRGQGFSLTGPGIEPNAPTHIQVEGLPSGFWALRQKAIRYPRGWDIYLVDGQKIIGLPRTTTLTAEE